MTNHRFLVPLAVSAVAILSAQPAAVELDPGFPLQTESRSIRLTGTLRADPGRGWKRVTWRRETSAGGEIAAGARWQTDLIALQPGDNHIVITALDRDGRVEQTGVRVYRTSADPVPDGSGTVELNGASVRYQVYGGTLVAEGCIELGPAEGKSGPRFALANPLAGQRWSGNTIPYVLDATLTPAMRTLFARAIAHWESLTPVRFTARASQANYLRVTRTDNPINTAGGVGMIGGEQIMRLREDAPFAIHVHEAGHTAGLLHEQNRADRDRFVRIDLNQVRKDEFQQMDPSNGLAVGLYDLQSVMHYEKNFVTRFGQRTLETIPAGLDVYTDEGLSQADVDAIFRIYGQARSRTTVTTSPAGLTVIVDGAPAAAPAVFEWTPGSRHTIEAPAGQGGGAVLDRFARWNNDGERTQTVTASAALGSYTANYVRHCKLTLRQPADSSLGSYTITPFAADGYYPCDSEVTLTAAPAEGVKFLDWTAAVGATNPRTFRVGQAYEIRPNFTRGQTIAFRTEPPGLTVRVNGANYFTPRSFATRDGAVFNVEAPNLNFGTLRYRFAKWSQGGNASQAIRIAGAGSVDHTLTYEPLYYASARPVPAAGGTVTLSPASADGFYAAGASVEFRATPAANRVFRAWDGDLKSATAATASLRIDEPRYAEASFRDLGSPTLAGFSPERVTAGSPPPLLFVTGNGFIEALSQVFVNGQRRDAFILDFNNLAIQLAPADLAAAGTLAVRVANPGRPDVAGGSRDFTVAAAPPGCSYSLTAAAVAAKPGFGTYAIGVATAAGCPWHAVTGASWLSVAGPAAGAGEGSVAIWTSPNPSPQPRTAQVRAGGQTIEVVQEGAACEFAVPAVSPLPLEGGAASLWIRSLAAGCEWQATGAAEWLSVGGDGAGKGNAELTVLAAANAGAPRESVLRIGRTSVSVRQAGAAGSIVNDANGLPALAPGSRFVIQGQGLAEADAKAEGVWPVQLGDIRVLFGETPARLVTVSPTLIAGQVPANVSGEVSVQVLRGDQPVSTQSIAIRESAPALYAADLGAASGAVLTVRLTGVGAANPSIADGEAAPAGAVPAAPVSAFLNGAELTVESVQLAAGEVGIAELRLRLPADAGPGEKSLVVMVGTSEASPVPVAVH